jgi:hypothetical protein
MSFLRRIVQLLRSLMLLERRIDEIKVNQGRILAMLQRDAPDGPLWTHEFKIFSQWGEDGILQFLTQAIPLRHRTFIEFGVEDFHESNCRFLLTKDRWRGFVIDGSEENMRRLRSADFYWKSDLRCRTAFITRENVSSLLEESGFDKEVGVLSIDLDGVDWHVLEALGAWRPAILVVEYNDAFGWTRPVTVPYSSDFVRQKRHSSNLYWGANLPAFLYLASARGYALVGTNSVGSNAFFVRRDLLGNRIREVELATCVRDASYRDSRGPDGSLTFLSGRARADVMADMEVLDVQSGETLRVGELSA